MPLPGDVSIPPLTPLADVCNFTTCVHVEWPGNQCNKSVCSYVPYSTLCNSQPPPYERCCTRGCDDNSMLAIRTCGGSVSRPQRSEITIEACSSAGSPARAHPSPRSRTSAARPFASWRGPRTGPVLYTGSFASAAADDTHACGDFDFPRSGLWSVIAPPMLFHSLLLPLLDWLLEIWLVLLLLLLLWYWLASRGFAELPPPCLAKAASRWLRNAFSRSDRKTWGSLGSVEIARTVPTGQVKRRKGLLDTLQALLQCWV